MKNILPFLIFAFCVLSPALLNAQDFSMQADTVIASTYTSPVYDTVITASTTGITLSWHVIATDFPSDWLASGALGLCDNKLCYGNGSGALWNGTSGTVYTSNVYTAPGGSYDYSPYLAGTTSVGPYYLTVKLTDLSGSRTATFIITKVVPTAVTNINNVSNDVVLYPNPARDELNIVYDASADVKNIAVYNIIGRVMEVYKVTDNNSANLNLENIPSGIYFVRLVNSQGGVVATKKFTKQ